MGFVELLWAYILVFILSAIPFLEAAAVIPIAILGGLSTVPVTILGLLGNMITVLLVIIFVDKIKQWRKNRKRGEDGEEVASKRSIRAKKLWEKYGLAGLALLGTPIVGSHLIAFMSLSLGGSKKMTTYWMMISVAIWGIALGILAHFGADFMYERTGREGFLFRLFKAE